MDTSTRGRPHDDEGVLARLDHDERGAQAMEYAMLGGAGTVAVTVISLILRSEWFQEKIRDFVDVLLGGLGDAIGGLIGHLPGV